jgi:hypothetical protein
MESSSQLLAQVLHLSGQPLSIVAHGFELGIVPRLTVRECEPIVALCGRFALKRLNLGRLLAEPGAREGTQTAGYFSPTAKTRRHKPSTRVGCRGIAFVGVFFTR